MSPVLAPVLAPVLRFCLAIAYFAVLLGVAWLTRAYHSGRYQEQLFGS